VQIWNVKSVPRSDSPDGVDGVLLSCCQPRSIFRLCTSASHALSISRVNDGETPIPQTTWKGRDLQNLDSSCVLSRYVSEVIDRVETRPYVETFQ
jgi:hypothetical protein